jgi:DNA repair exonuclease SbcCD ATPase subunit
MSSPLTPHNLERLEVVLDMLTPSTHSPWREDMREVFRLAGQALDPPKRLEADLVRDELKQRAARILDLEAQLAVAHRYSSSLERQVLELKQEVAVVERQRDEIARLQRSLSAMTEARDYYAERQSDHLAGRLEQALAHGNELRTKLKLARDKLKEADCFLDIAKEHIRLGLHPLTPTDITKEVQS